MLVMSRRDDDEVELHEQDTLNAGAGLCDREAVRTLVEEGPAAIEKLIEWGAEFDREGTHLLFAREGASVVVAEVADDAGRQTAADIEGPYRRLWSSLGRRPSWREVAHEISVDERTLKRARDKFGVTGREIGGQS